MILIRPEKNGQKIYPDKEMEKVGNVYKVRQELETRDDIQIFTWPYTAANCGLTMVMKKEPNRPYYKL